MEGREEVKNLILAVLFVVLFCFFLLFWKEDITGWWGENPIKITNGILRGKTLMGLSGRGSMKGRKILPFWCCVLFRELSCGGVRGGGRGHFDSKSEWLCILNYPPYLVNNWKWSFKRKTLAGPRKFWQEKGGKRWVRWSFTPWPK